MREVEAGISFCLSLPLDFPGGTALNQRRHPPVLAPTEDMDGNAGTFYNVHMSEMDDFGDPKYVDVWADDVVTLSLQYSTQWDSLAHVGAEFDADGDGVEEAVYYNGYRAGVDLVGPAGRRRGRRRRPPLLRAPPRPRAHGLPRRAGARRARRPRPPPRPRLARRRPEDARRRSWRPTTSSWSPATCCCCTPASPPRSSSGTATPIPGRSSRRARYLDARDESLLEWIADSQISALVADNYAVEGLLGKDRDPSRHSFLPIHHLCLFKLGVPLGELWYLHELAAWLREHDRSRFLLTAPPLRLPGAWARRRRRSRPCERTRFIDLDPETQHRSTCWSSAPASPASTSCTAPSKRDSPRKLLEAGDGVGGTWYWNRYPGARFDSESYTYALPVLEGAVRRMGVAGALRRSAARSSAT